MQLRTRRRVIDYSDNKRASSTSLNKRDESGGHQNGPHKQSAKNDSSQPFVKRGRGRPRKNDAQPGHKNQKQLNIRSNSVSPEFARNTTCSTVGIENRSGHIEDVTIPKKKRGRPPKRSNSCQAAVETDDSIEENVVKKKRRGRPPKQKQPDDHSKLGSSSSKAQAKTVPTKRTDRKRTSNDQGITTDVPLKRGRGRPRKVVKQNAAEISESESMTPHSQPSETIHEANDGSSGDPSPPPSPNTVEPGIGTEHVATQVIRDTIINERVAQNMVDDDADEIGDTRMTEPDKSKKTNQTILPPYPPIPMPLKTERQCIPSREVPLTPKLSDSLFNVYMESSGPSHSSQADPNPRGVLIEDALSNQLYSLSEPRTSSIKQEPLFDIEENVMISTTKVAVKQEPSTLAPEEITVAECLQQSPAPEEFTAPENSHRVPGAILKEEKSSSEESDSDSSDSSEDDDSDNDDDDNGGDKDESENSSDDEDENEGGNGRSSTNKDNQLEPPQEEDFSDSNFDENEDQETGSPRGRHSAEHTWLENLNASLKAVATPKMATVPDGIREIQKLWSDIKAVVSDDVMQQYEKNLQGILTGRVSCLIPIRVLVEDFPEKLLRTHERLYNLLCLHSGAFPFQNHNGTDLVSKHWLADSTKIGAQILLTCLTRNVLPFDVMAETNVCQLVEESVRIRVKDMLDDIVNGFLDSKKTSIAEIPASILSKYLNP